MLRLTRRAFLISSTLAGASALFEPGSAWRAGRAIAAPAPSWPVWQGRRPRPAPLALAQGTDYAALVKQVVDGAGGVSALGRAGERVVIKPTLTWNRTPDQGANVHPDVLEAVIKLALAGGAQDVLIFDRTALPAATAYRVSGVRRMVQRLADERVRLVTLAAEDFIPLHAIQNEALTTNGQIASPSVPGRKQRTARHVVAQPEIDPPYVCRQILEADRLINIATAKVHPTRQVSLALANLLGLVGGGPADAAWHQHKDLELALLSAAIRPDLTILDATRAVVRNGPAGRGFRDVEHWDTVVASRDALAVEAYGARRLGVPPATLPYLTLAEELGVGVAALTAKRIIER